MVNRAPEGPPQEGPPKARPAGETPSSTTPTATKKTTLSRGKFLRGLGATAVGLGTGLIGPDLTRPLEPKSAGVSPATASELKQEHLTDEMAAERIYKESEHYGVDVIGNAISDNWKGKDGAMYVAYEGAILRGDPQTGKVGVWNTLTVMENNGLYDKLEDGSLGVTVPQSSYFVDNANGNLDLALDTRAKHFNIPSNVIEWVNNIRQRGCEPGVYRSKGKHYGEEGHGYTVYRLDGMAAQVWDDGRIERILIGNAARAAGLIPKEALLKSESTSPQERSAKTVRYLNEVEGEKREEAQKKLDIVREVVENLQLQGLISEARIKQDIQFGQNRAAEELFHIRKDGKSEIDMVNLTPEKEIPMYAIHALGHGLYPDFGVYDYLLNEDDLQQISNINAAMKTAYRENFLGKGKLLTSYESRIWLKFLDDFSGTIWQDFSKDIGLPPTNPFMGVNQEELHVLQQKTEINPVYRDVVQEFLEERKDLQHQSIVGHDVAAMVLRRYWKDSKSLESLPLYHEKQLGEKLEALAADLEREMYAELVYLSFVDPKRARKLFKEGYNVISTVYPKVSGKSLEEAAMYTQTLHPKKPEFLSQTQNEKEE